MSSASMRPGVYFGTTGLRPFGTCHRRAWFAVDANRQIPLIGT